MQEIVFFIPYGMETPGGAERVTASITNELVKLNKYNIKIITFNGCDSFYKLDSRIEILSLGIDKYENFFLRKIQPLKYLKKYRSIIKSINPKIVINFGVESVVFDSLALLGINNIKKYTWEHNSFYQPTYKILKILRRIFYKYLDKIIVLNETDAKEFRKLFNKEKVCVIPNPIPWMSSSVSNLKNKTAISVGRYHPVKGFDMLIKAFKQIVEKDKEWKLELYGKDEGEKENLLNLVNELNLKDNVFLNDQTKNIKEKYLQSSLYIMSSRYESFGMVLLEAKECGLPIVSFDCMSGPRDIIKDGEDGYLAKYLDINDLTNKIWVIASNEEMQKKFALNAKKNVEMYKINRIIEQWENIMEVN